ncbi:dTDP-4-amino-4,6-dideoxygalactose transaminase [Kineothrix alysoides]|uniref:dTDP-4-amino-4,6-dideoxygalactose transaminase n=1 Tax=Kineothrix alysoides TaxID=1469948 RepID=A0A4R1R1Z8_9FIRM|nr:DegT/DnrJ/EryC1/StrS family aminotransferase [Kineothrix alysoides]TCL59374.1 dTDP-4-amino-4,6-dideoxygalactose transaminase [Kineothrix alysoides]
MDNNIYVTRSSMPPYEEYIEMIKPLWESHKLTNMGENHKKLESELKKYLGVKNVSLMTNGHMALEMALQAMHLSGEVITTPFTFVSTTHAIVRNNLTPVFCDINERDLTIDVDKIEELITEKTSAIVPVHVYGHICDVERIEQIAKKYNLKVIYDAAHAFGVTYKDRSITAYGDASILSFHATKVFNTIEGGAVVYESEKLGHELYGLKNFGIRNELTIDGVGANAKMDEFRAIMGLCNLKYVDQEARKRELIVSTYQKELNGINGIRYFDKQKSVRPNYSYFPIIIDENKYGICRDDLYDRLKEYGIFTRKYFYPLVSNTECYSKNYYYKNLEIASNISERVLTLPLYSELSIENVKRICGLINNIGG